MDQPQPLPVWSQPAADAIARLGSSTSGLAAEEAARRLAAARNDLGEESRARRAAKLLFRQFNTPMVLILIVGAGLSIVLKSYVDAFILLVILLATGLLGFFQEFRASEALKALENQLALRARVIRDGKPVSVPASDIVAGDVIELAAGALIPADGLLLDANDFLVSEAALTGESMPVEKRPGVVAAEEPLARRTNLVFAGTSVRSGMARAVVTVTGKATELGAIAGSIAQEEPETDFERGVRRFGYLLMKVMIVLVVAVLAVNAALGRPVIDSLLFAIALAVGMTPELLPAIVSVTLSAGARDLAARGVLVRRLSSLENLGSMDILCTDKTGTLTEGTVSLANAVSPTGETSDEVLTLAFLNAHFETGIENPLDQAILAACPGKSPGNLRKIDEIPYDFIRKRLTIVVEDEAGKRRLICKGAFASILSCCTAVRTQAGSAPLDDARRRTLEEYLAARGAEGFRLLAVASRDVALKPDYDRSDEADLTLEGFLLFADPPKQDAPEVIATLAKLGVTTKIISGDSKDVAAHVARAVGLGTGHILTGAELARMSDEALAARAGTTGIFCEIDPQQKERIILSLQKRGRVVGYMGDGINDAPALHAADVGISVDQAVDVARQSADLVLLKRDLSVLVSGIACGRKTFANTQKYIAITTSANFGNMVSMALATPFLPFLPLLAKQVLLNNFLSDFPAIAISTDNVETETTARAEHWDINELRRFMVVFGLVSSVFDLIAFVLLLEFVAAGEQEFQTAWFTVSLLTEVLVVLSLRNRASAFASRPSLALLVSTVAVAVLAVAIPYLGPAAALFGFAALPLPVSAALVAIAVTYVAATEISKRWFYRKLQKES